MYSNKKQAKKKTKNNFFLFFIYYFFFIPKRDAKNQCPCCKTFNQVKSSRSLPNMKQHISPLTLRGVKTKVKQLIISQTKIHWLISLAIPQV